MRPELVEGKIYPSNAFSAVGEVKFDTVVSNLPAKVGRELLYIILSDAKDHLHAGGQIVVVTISGLKEFIKRNFKEVFGNYEKQSLDDFILLLEQVGEWLWQKGIKQWAPGSFHKNRAKLEHFIENGCLILAYQTRELAGGCILSAVNPGWPQPSDEALYLNSLVVARFAAGQGLGTKIINICAEVTRQKGKNLIRLDCWDGNSFLRSYYQRAGFKMLEAIPVNDYFVRLFEKDVSLFN